MKRKLTSILLMSALLVGGASTFVSCKDYDGDQAAVQNANLAKLQEVVTANKAALDAAIAGKQDQLPADVLENLNQLGTAIENAETAADWVRNYGQLKELADKMTAISAVLGYQDLLSKLDAATKDWEWPESMSDLVQRTELTKYVSKEELAPYLEKLEGFETKDDLQKDVHDIINAWTKELADNFTSYEDFVKQMSVVPAEITAINEALEGLEAKLNIVNNKVAKLVTDINIDMVENPYFGTINTPFGIKSTMLIGFVGSQITKKQAAKFEGTEAGLAVSATGGAIYLTINPSDIDAKGMNFALVGRDESAAPAFTLKPLVADNTPVTTISTRADRTVNGYKAVFAIDKETATKAYPNIDKQALKDVATNVIGKIKGQEGLDIANAVKTIYDTFTGAIPQYYALQASWDETQLDGTSKTRYVNSDFNISAFTVKPLGYTTNIGTVGAKYDIPQIPSLQQWLNANIKDFTYDPVDVTKIKDVIVEIPDINEVKVSYDDPTNTNLSGGTLSWTIDPSSSSSTTVSIDFSKITISEGDKKAQITVELDDLRKVVEDLNTQVENMVGDVNKLFDKAESLAGRFDNIASKVNTVISAANKFLDNANQYLQPIMLAAGNGSLVRLSEVPGIYTQFKSNGEEGKIVLVPTSYTIELLAPAYLKKITVDNKEVTTTHDGTQKTVEAILEKGQHTITYSSMDYFGYVVTKDYYVEVK